jgi:putative aldouronate transport system substrate-binding protein
MITRDARNPEAIFRMGDLMCSEEASIWNRFGRPEIDWRVPRPGERSMYHDIGMPARLAQVLPWGAIQNSHWANGAPSLLPMGILDGQVAPDNPLDNERWVSAAVPLHLGLYPPDANRVDFTLHTFQEMEEIADLKLTINTYVNEMLALFVTGQRDIEREWDAYIRELDRMGLARYIQLTQAGYERAIGVRR